MVPDTEDPYCPAPQGLVAPLHAVRDMVRLPTNDSRVTHAPS